MSEEDISQTTSNNIETNFDNRKIILNENEENEDDMVEISMENKDESDLKSADNNSTNKKLSDSIVTSNSNNNSNTNQVISDSTNITMATITPTSQLADQRNTDIVEKVHSIKEWGKNTFLRTRQKVLEKLSKTSRTVDVELEDKIEMIKVEQIQLRMMVTGCMSRQMDLVQQEILTKQSSSRMMSEMSQVTPGDLGQLYLTISQQDTSSSERSKELLGKLTQISTALNTLINKTYADCLLSCELFEKVRLEYDAYKTESARQVAVLQTAALQSSNGTNQSDANKLDQLQKSLEEHRKKYESTKSDLMEKMELLHDNRKRVMEREILQQKLAWFTYHTDNATIYNCGVTNK